jgi:AcrR family transcriptional regulator
VDDERLGRTQPERRAASEAALLRAAAELIADHGLEGATLRNIGARAGASRAMPGYHFGSKDELVTRLFHVANERTQRATAEAVERAHGDLSTMTTLESLRVIAETYLEIVASSDGPEERAVVVMWGASFPTESTLAAVRESDAENHELLAALIRTGQAEGSIRPDVTATAAAAMLMGMVRGIAGLSVSHPTLANTAAVRELCGSAIVDALATRSDDATTPGRDDDARPERPLDAPDGAPA